MRRKSRELALQFLFQSEFAPEISIYNFMNLFDQHIDKPTSDYAVELYKGVQSHKEKIDEKIKNTSRHWKIERMASVDRNILRSAIYEMFYAQETIEPKIVINEALEIAKIYGSQESSSFINGLLDQIVKSH